MPILITGLIFYFLPEILIGLVWLWIFGNLLQSLGDTFGFIVWVVLIIAYRAGRAAMKRKAQTAATVQFGRDLGTGLNQTLKP